MAEPGWIDVQAPGVDLKALSWGPPDAPIALCLHGFPDTAYGWRKFAPRLVEAGWRVIERDVRYGPRTGGKSKVSGSIRGSLVAAHDFWRAMP